jgi:hypothetical protein
MLPFRQDVLPVTDEFTIFVNRVSGTVGPDVRVPSKMLRDKSLTWYSLAEIGTRDRIESAKSPKVVCNPGG